MTQVFNRIGSPADVSRRNTGACADSAADDDTVPPDNIREAANNLNG